MNLFTLKLNDREAAVNWRNVVFLAEYYWKVSASLSSGSALPIEHFPHTIHLILREEAQIETAWNWEVFDKITELQACSTYRLHADGLTSEVEDTNRNKCERENAEEILTVFNPEDLILFGLESDLAAHGTEFLRFFDVHFPDPALLPRRTRNFTAELNRLILEGRILHKSNTNTVTGIILETLASKKATFFWRDQARTLGPVSKHDAVLRALKRVQTCARLLIETIDLEFHDSLLPQWWEVFDLYGWQNVVPGQEAEVDLQLKLTKLCRSRSWNDITVGREFDLIKKIALKLFQAFPEHVRAADGVDGSGGVSESGGVSALDSGGRGSSRGLNKRCWAEALTKAEVENGPLPHGKRFYAWYRSECQSTCDVERLIGIVKKHAADSDIGSSVLRDFTTVTAFGPEKKTDLATRHVVGDTVRLEPTDFLLRCNKIWLGQFGRRYHPSPLSCGGGDQG